MARGPSLSTASARRSPRSAGAKSRAEAAAILGRVIRDELALIAGLARDLRDVNVALRRHFHRPDFPDLDRARDCPWNFSETIQRAVELQEGIRDRLGTSRAKILSEPSVPESERSTAPEGPKAKRPPIQPTTRQASFQPPPSPRPEPKPLTNETIAASTVRKHEASPEEMNRIMRWPAPHWLVPTTR